MNKEGPKIKSLNLSIREGLKKMEISTLFLTPPQKRGGKNRAKKYF